MKRLLTLVVLGLFALRASAQTAAIVVTTPPCNLDGVLTLNTTGLTPPLTVTWYLTTGTVVHTSSTTSDVLTGYAGGPISYVYVTNGTLSASTSLSAGMPPFTFTYSSTPAVCPALGTATATATGGTAPYSYQWMNNPSGTLAATGSPASLASGNYDVLITDAAGCVYGSVYSGDSIAVYNTPAFSFGVTTTPANCTNGTATVGTITGGTAPFSYLWSTGATSSGITGMHMGYYPVTVTDANGCTSNNYGSILQSITIGAAVTPTPATCLATDGAIIAFGSGGVPPYSYVWNNGATTQSQSGLTSGYYSVIATDANGCIGNGGGSVGSSSPISTTYVATPSSCTAPTGSATLTIAGGTTPYTVNWYTTPPQTGNTATALNPGTYGFHITDAVGCVRTGSVVINPMDIIYLGFSTTPATCTLSNGTASVTATGGVGALSYAWTSGVGSTTSAISAVHSGYYGVTVTDANGCSKTGNAYVGVYSPLNTALSTTAPTCLFTNDGSIHAVPYGGTMPYNFSWSVPGTGSTISSLGAGYYSVYVTDAVGCTDYTAVHLNASTADISCYCNINGVVYHDLNGNCTQDAGETGIPNVQIHCSGRGYAYTDASGHYSFLVPSGTYTITETVQAFYPLSPCQLNGISVVAVASTGCTNVVNFANATSTIHDIHVSTWDYNHPIPGNAYTQATIITNDGTVSESSILAGYKADGQIYAPSFIPSGIFTGSPYWYGTAAGFPTLSPGGSQAFYDHYSVPTDVPLGTNLVFKDSAAYTAPMSNWLTDYTPWNNVNYFNSTVVASYDPNFKEVSPKGTGTPGYISYSDSVLEYMVHFQNTGTYFAEKVEVIDTLDPNLDWTTLRPVFQSHHCVVTLNENGVAKFTFDNIHLPWASNYPATSNGMFTYTIKTRHGLALGTQIKNAAAIYFDFNEPIMTNRTLNTIGSNVGVTPMIAPEASFSVYPNPAENTCFAVINSAVAGNADIKLMDITGKMLMIKTVSLQTGSQTVPVEIDGLVPGMYFVTLVNGGKAETQKLVIMK